jgi:hypothetical protein
MVKNCDNKRNKLLYSDIVITADHQRIVLELLATATKNDLDEHFERVLKYAELLSADNIWIVHFTCEDGQLGNFIGHLIIKLKLYTSFTTRGCLMC